MMKVSRLVLSIMLSLALVVTFIPVTSFAQDDGANAQDEGIYAQPTEEVTVPEDEAAGPEFSAKTVEHPVSFNGIDSFSISGSEYHAELEHATIWVWNGRYDQDLNRFFTAEGSSLWFEFEMEDGWYVDSAQYSMDSGATKVDAGYDVSDDEWYVEMPESASSYEVEIYVTIKKAEMLHSITVSVKPLVCGTIVTGNSVSGSSKQTPQPEVSFPAGAQYRLGGDESQGVKYALWYKGSSLFDGDVVGGETYNADMELVPKKGFEFADDCKVYSPDGQVVIQDHRAEWLYLAVPIKAVHDWVSESKTPAGLLKNGTDVQRCKAEGCTAKKSVVTPGWAKYYVKKLKVKKGKKSFTVKWKKQSKKNLKKFNGYQIRYSTSANMAGAKTVNAGKKSKGKKIKKLAKKTKYFVQVRTFTKKGNDTFYSQWSKVKKVKTK